MDITWETFSSVHTTSLLLSLLLLRKAGDGCEEGLQHRYLNRDTGGALPFQGEADEAARVGRQTNNKASSRV